MNAFDNGSFVLGDNNATAPCFLAGTRLLTRSGYRAVEELQVGDEVQTLNNGWQAIRWLGHRVEGKLANGTFPFKSQPIRIASHAFGPELPARDLWVSPDHAVFFRNHLIPAKHLVNGENIIRDADLESITYYHVLLDKHAVIFSEGLPTESYVPQENLGSFDNVDTCPEALRNDIVAPIGLYADCYPRASQGGIVETARAYLARNLADAVKLAAA
ncbi:Hint domain-containing protein [Methylomagnum sp.]